MNLESPTPCTDGVVTFYVPPDWTLQEDHDEQVWTFLHESGARLFVEVLHYEAACETTALDPLALLRAFHREHPGSFHTVPLHSGFALATGALSEDECGQPADAIEVCSAYARDRAVSVRYVLPEVQLEPSTARAARYQTFLRLARQTHLGEPGCSGSHHAPPPEVDAFTTTTNPAAQCPSPDQSTPDFRSPRLRMPPARPSRASQAKRRRR